MTLILAIDTCLSSCSAALVQDGQVLAQDSRTLTQGHAEVLPVMIPALYQQSNRAPSETALIGVTIGPGGFAGARIGPSYARGVALATGARCHGITVLDALAEPYRNHPEPVIVIQDARRDEFYWQVFDSGEAKTKPKIGTIAEMQQNIPVRPCLMIGSGVAFLDTEHPVDPTVQIDILAVARLSREALITGRLHPASPYYLRAPDAKPQTPPVL